MISSKMTFIQHQKKLITQKGMTCTITDFNVPTRRFCESTDKHHFLNFYYIRRALEAINDIKDISPH